MNYNNIFNNKSNSTETTGKYPNWTTVKPPLVGILKQLKNSDSYF